ncbi:uncharacterized protein BDW70DRAFT_167080 [Aspergillus foveolatus]|uniref:uncharacterized protein n=1 Tax=Aspergillus foveolatus TaxID=210207 RepID=UPI003CCD1C28
MIFFFPILFALAGTCITLLFSNRIRQYRASVFITRQPDRDRVVVKGHTYSEAVSGDQKTEVESGSESLSTISQVEIVRRVCIIGAGKEGVITGVVLASYNPDVEFCVTDADEELISLWNSDTLPFSEPGLENMLFDDGALHATRGEDKREDRKHANIDHGQDQDQQRLTGKETIAHVERRKKLSNLTFSTDIHGALVPAQLVFLCLEMDPSAGAADESLSHSYLDSALHSIALASRGHKVIVQRSTAPYGATAYIKNRLQAISSPKAIHTVLTSPVLAVPFPGSLIASMLTPSSVIIGHIFSATASTSAITALKRLYASFVPEDRIVTMDAYSAELGAISAKAVIAQQMMALNSVHMICGKVEASSGNVGWILGGLDIAAVRTGVRMRREVRCLVNLATGLGMEEVKAYWEGVLKLEGMKYRRDVRDFVGALKQDEDRKKVALILTDAMGDQETALVLLDELERAEVTIRVWVDRATKEQSHNVLQTVRGRVEGIEVADSLESACAGSNAVILHGSLGIRDEAMQAIADKMKRPKALLNLGDRVEEMKMRQLGFRPV